MFQDPYQYDCVSVRKLLQLAMARKGSIFGDCGLEKDEIEEVSVCKERERYTVVSMSPCELYYIERHIFLACIGENDRREYLRGKNDLPDDVSLRKLYY